MHQPPAASPSKPSCAGLPDVFCRCFCQTANPRLHRGLGAQRRLTCKCTRRHERALTSHARCTSRQRSNPPAKREKFTPCVALPYEVAAASPCSPPLLSCDFPKVLDHLRHSTLQSALCYSVSAFQISVRGGGVHHPRSMMRTAAAMASSQSRWRRVSACRRRHVCTPNAGQIVGAVSLRSSQLAARPPEAGDWPAARARRSSLAHPGLPVEKQRRVHLEWKSNAAGFIELHLICSGCQPIRSIFSDRESCFQLCCRSCAASIIRRALRLISFVRSAGT
jgi:hypothetical protein